MKNKIIYGCIFVGIIITLSVGFYFGMYLPKKARIAEQQKQEQKAEQEKATIEEKRNDNSDNPLKKITDAIAEGNAHNLENIPKLTEEEAYKSPFVTHIRVVLNKYLAGNDMENDVEINDADGSDGNLKCGLANFDKAYYKSKFVVLRVKPNKYGGMLTSIVFVDKPDASFWVWVYEYGEKSGKYVLGSFCEEELADKAEFKESMKTLLEKPGEFPYSL
ncbi:MAG TPA: hypothetical protein DCE80_13150 [Ignavibacteriales bacterium]|nr:hypothetical protein [Ignavibacteriales bacterium]